MHFLSALNGGIKLKRLSVKIKVNSLVLVVVRLLTNLGYIQSYLVQVYKKKGLYIHIKLKNHLADGLVMRGVYPISTPGSQVFLSNKALLRMNRQGNVTDPLKTVIISTSKLGVCTSNQATLVGMGGKALAIVY